MKPSLTVIDPGPLTLVEDQGRPGSAALGVAHSGVADGASAALALRLVGNPPAAAVFESLLGGLRFTPSHDCIVAVTGAEAGVTVDGQSRDRCRALLVRAGEDLAVATAQRGLRVYVAVRGGLDAAVVLGSRSYDTIGRLGPAPVAPGDVVPVGGSDAVEDPWFEAVAVPRIPDEVVVVVRRGPHDDALDAQGWRSLLDARWTVSSDSDRIGVRLDGPALPAPPGDVASFPVVPRSVQLPPSGRPIILGPDAGVTGGYPVLGVVDDAGRDALAQARPGTAVRFRRG